MEIANKTLFESASALQWLKKQKKPTATSLKIGHQLKAFDPLLEVIRDEQEIVRRDHTLMDPDTGAPVTGTQDGQVGTRVVNQFEYEDAMKGLMDATVEISVKPMEWKLFEKTFKQIEPGHLMALVAISFVEDPDAKGGDDDEGLEGDALD